MKDTIEKIIKHNSPEVASEKIMHILNNLVLDSEFNIDDIRNAFNGGIDAVDAGIQFDECGSGDKYGKKIITKKFKVWFHEYSLIRRKNRK